MKLLGSRQDAGEGGSMGGRQAGGYSKPAPRQGPAGAASQPKPAAKRAGSGFDDMDDDIPF